MGPLGWTDRCPGLWKNYGNQLNLICGVTPLEVGHTAFLQHLIWVTVILARKWAHHVLNARLRSFRARRPWDATAL